MYVSTQVKKVLYLMGRCNPFRVPVLEIESLESLLKEKLVVKEKLNKLKIYQLKVKKKKKTETAIPNIEKSCCVDRKISKGLMFFWRVENNKFRKKLKMFEFNQDSDFFLLFRIGQMLWIL